ncbi:MAG TPA: c-type cytochrome [Chthoniobacter sp.]|nr:c-type cytochrome [Chthoniobacter sp.]
MTDSPAPTPTRPKRAGISLGRLLLVVLVLVMVAGGFVYRYVVGGGLKARQRPGALEAFVAEGLVNLSIPNEVKALKSPLDASPDGADMAAGRELYQKHCESCHGFDGNGNTKAGEGVYPPPVSLSHAALARRHRTDGELFYFIRNGVRNTAMPGWQLPDQQTWQLVAFVRNLPVTAGLSSAASLDHPLTNAQFVGSASCEKCHSDIYARWKKTPMANVVRDPKEHPDAITPDLASGDPLVTFTKDDIAFVYGSLWKQRYFKKVGDDYYPFPAQWDVTHKKWKPYFVKDDWWAPLYPPDNFQRPTSALCDGCHSVNYDIKTKIVSEWNVGCEKCHGPGSEHVKQATAANILCPSRMDYMAANDSCIQCHSQGQPLTNPIDGKYYDWPVGYDVRKKLSDYWKLEEHELGKTTFTHFPDGTAHKNRMQGNDYVASQMYTHGVTCFTCHDVHGTEYPSNLRKPASSLCLDCHGPNSPSGPRTVTLEAHTHHKAGSAGSECIACHMPKIAQTIGDVNVRSHTFRFVSPAETDSMKIPNACNVCHTDKTSAWATEALMTWSDRSPWRGAK